MVLVNGSSINNNSGTGIVANGGTATVRVGASTISGNATGINAAGGSQINSFGNNRLIGNPSVGAPNNGTFVGGPIPPA